MFRPPYYTKEHLELLLAKHEQRIRNRVPFKHTASVWVIITLALLIAVGYGVSKLFC